MTARKHLCIVEALEKEYRRSPCGYDAGQYVGAYSENPGYASTFAAIAAGNGNVMAALIASSDAWIHRVRAGQT